MKQYLVMHKDHIPEGLSSFPRNLNDTYFVFSDQGEAVEALELPEEVDEEGNPLLSLEQTVALVAGAMLADTPVIRLKQPDALTLLATPHWRIYVGGYEDKDMLEADALEALGVNVDKRKSLATLEAETQAALMVALQ